MPDARDRDAAEEVEVLVAVGVPQPGTLAAHELDGRARVGRDDPFALDLLQLRQAHGEASIFVPIPASVNSSSSSEWAIRPSRMCAALTPWLIASTHASSLGRMPPSSFGMASMTRLTLACPIRLVASAGSPSQPATS